MSKAETADIIGSFGYPISSLELAESLDKNDKFSKFRQEFVIPTHNSLSGDHQVTGTSGYN